MERKTFKFKTEKSWIRVWNALNDTFYTFTSFGNKSITVFGTRAIQEVRQSCKKCKISFEEI